MHYSLPLEQMTTEDKIRTMEELWDDLCRRSADIVSPCWHHEVLTEREGAVTVGEAAFEEWGTAKQRIRESLK